MNPQLEVDTVCGVPPWRQVHDQLRALVGSGALPPGTALPTVRQLANDLGLAAGTVARAYRELEAAELIVTAGRAGTTVADRPAPAPAELPRLAVRFVRQARALGADRAEVMDAVAAAWGVSGP